MSSRHTTGLAVSVYGEGVHGRKGLWLGYGVGEQYLTRLCAAGGTQRNGNYSNCLSMWPSEKDEYPDGVIVVVLFVIRGVEAKLN